MPHARCCEVWGRWAVKCHRGAPNTDEHHAELTTGQTAVKRYQDITIRAGSAQKCPEMVLAPRILFELYRLGNVLLLLVLWYSTLRSVFTCAWRSLITFKNMVTC